MQEDLDRLRDGETGVKHNSHQQMQLSRICRVTKQQKAKKISIDPPSVEKLSRRQELCRFIHQVREAIKIAIRKSLRSSTDSKVSRRCRASF